MRFSNPFGFFSISDFPGCKWIGVSHFAFILKKHRNGGKGTEANKERLRIAKELGYNYLICTVNSSNAAQIKLLLKNGWKQLDSFISHEETTILIFGKET